MSISSAFRTLEFLRADPLQTTRVVPDPLRGPTQGSVLLQIERFVLSSNNVTYALNGDRLGYWAPFPAGEPGWGRVPAWGAARAIDGDPELARPGELFIGFLPMATHVLVQAEPLRDGLRATAPERDGLYPLYRDMTRVDDDIDDDELAVLPGVPTAAHLADELQASSPAQVVFSSATSRTALTTAVLLRRAGIRVVGLTAATRIGVAALAGVFDDVLSYDEIADIAPVVGTAYADVAGRPEFTAAVHRALGPALARSLRIGATHAGGNAEDTARVPVPPPGPPIEGFNVGLRRVEVADRIGEEQLTVFEQNARGLITEWAAEHLTIERVSGLEEARQAWQHVWRGEIQPLASVMIIPS
jgi:hypothetical protein